MRPQPTHHLATAQAVPTLNRHQSEALKLVRAFREVQQHNPPASLISEALGLTTPLSGAYVLRTLERRGLLALDPSDGSLSLTDKGARLVSVAPVSR